MQLFAPANISSVSVRGIEITVANDSSVEIPDEMLNEFLDIGFVSEAPTKPVFVPKKG
jgi:histidinol phosphatase-like PHP family hydrolase